MVDGGSLENCCTATYRGFESLFLRKKRQRIRAAFLLRLRDSGPPGPLFPLRYPYPKPLSSGEGLAAEAACCPEEGDIFPVARRKRDLPLLHSRRSGIPEEEEGLFPYCLPQAKSRRNGPENGPVS